MSFETDDINFTNGMTFDIAYQNYYAILKSSYVAEENTKEPFKSPFLEKAETEDGSLVNTFVQMIKQLSKYERQKEKAYLSKWLEKYKTNTTLYEQLNTLLNGESPNYSKAFELVELRRMGFLEEIKNFEEEFIKWQEQYKQFSNNFIKKEMERILIEDIGDKIFNMTPTQLIDQLIEGIQLEWNNRYKNYSSETFSYFLASFKEDLTTIIKDMKVFKGKNKEFMDKKFQGSLSSTFKAKSPKDLSSSIKAKIIDGLVNGLPQESFLTLFGEGASTARAQRELKFFTKNKIQFVPTETDVYAIIDFTQDNNINKDVAQEIKKLSQDSDIQRRITGEDLKNNFIIHYSSKDLTIAEESGSGSSVTAKIKGESSLDSKIDGLLAIGRAAGKEDFVKEVIFEAVNTGKDLLYGNETTVIDRVTKSLVALSFSFMFDDFERQFEQIIVNTTENGNEINLYMISGNFYASSDILTFLAAFVEDKLNYNKEKQVKSFINIGFKPAPENYYNSNELQGLITKERWEIVRNKVISNTMMSVRLSTNVLKDLTYTIGNYIKE